MRRVWPGSSLIKYRIFFELDSNAWVFEKHEDECLETKERIGSLTVVKTKSS